jgi:hypothetical protein
MTTEAVDAVVGRLSVAGFEMLGRHVQVGSLQFEFSAVLLGPEETLDLAIVVESVSDSESGRLRQTLEGLGRALDMAGSKRTITTVVVGAPPSGMLLQAMRSIGRYLLLPDEQDLEHLIEDRLAILLPLDLGDVTEDAVDPEKELLGRLQLAEDDERRLLIAAASRGAAEVQAELKHYIEAPLTTDSDR